MWKLILRIFGWEIKGEFPALDKSLVVVAPHTAYWDGFFGFLALKALKIPFGILGDASLFHFPMIILMKIIHAFPVNVKGKDAIHACVNLFHQNDKLHLIMCPEGQLAPTDRWNPGFYHIARLAEVPVVVARLDYKSKELEIKTVITDLSDQKAVFEILKEAYTGANACYPEKFLLPEKNLK